jgi:hypothetical protein
MKYLFLFVFICIPIFSFAQNYEPKDVSELRAQYNLLVDLRNDKAISESVFETKTTELKQLATEKLNVNLDGLELKQVVPAQRIDWIGSALYIVSAILVFALLVPLMAKFRKPIIALIRFMINNEFFKNLARLSVKFVVKTWEYFAYATLLLALYYFDNEYVVLLVSFTSGSLISYSILSRRNEEDKKLSANSISWILTILWAAIAYFYDNGFVGFLSVASFVSSSGFVMIMFPGVIGIGFKKTRADYVLRLTGIALVLSLFSWLLFYTNYIPALASLKEQMKVFEVGMVSLIPLVYFCGLGYLTFFWYRRHLWIKIVSELIALGSGVFVLTVALLYGIASMFWIGLFFMTWDAIDKYHELIYKRVDFVWAGLIFAAILGAFGYHIKNNMVTIMNALEFLNL